MHDKRKRSAGELAFNFLMFLVSLFLMWKAFMISGFSSLSSPGALPMAVALTMAISSGLILLNNFRHTLRDETTFVGDIVPPVVILMMLAITGYALLLVPLGFLPTSLLFLVLSILFLRRGGLVFALLVSLCSLVCIYIIFRMVFEVLMPPGIVAEGRILAAIARLFGGAN